MSLHQITEMGYVYWYCHLEECGALLRAHIEDSALSYRTYFGEHCGSCIVMPQCPACGGRLELKADWTLSDIRRELRYILDSRMLDVILDERGAILGVAMILTYARCFRLLNMLYVSGKLPVLPVLPVLNIDAINASPLAELPLDIVDSFWLGYMCTGKVIEVGGVATHLIAVAGDTKPLMQLPMAIMEVRKEISHAI